MTNHSIDWLVTLAWSSVILKVKGVVPASPSLTLVVTAAIDTIERSSFWIVPRADDVPRVRPAETFDRATVKVSSNSTVVERR